MKVLAICEQLRTCGLRHTFILREFPLPGFIKPSLQQHRKQTRMFQMMHAPPADADEEKRARDGVRNDLLTFLAVVVMLEIGG